MAEDDAGSTTTAHEEKKHTKQQRMLIIIGIVSLVLVYVMMKRSSSASGTGAQTAQQQSALAAYEAQLASQSYGSQQAAYGSNASDPVLMQMLQALGTIQSEVATMQPASTAATAAPAAAPKNAGYGEVQTAQGLMAWLGIQDAQKGYSGYEVGAGAPVFFGNAETLSEGMKPGDVYTPVAYEPFISTSPTHTP